MKLHPKLVSLSLAFSLVLSLTACSRTPASGGSASGGSEPADIPASHTEASSVQTGGGKTLIAYFTADENRAADAVTSASVTTVDGVDKGRVRAVADMIAKVTGGDLFSIQTSVEYPEDGGELIDYASEEQAQNARPELTAQIENLEDYDTVFIGYPTWWYDMPQILYSFFDAYDFSGKTLIPFNIHNGSRFSGTIDTIQELEPEAMVIEDGFTVSEKTVADAAGDVAAWLEGLGY